MKLKELTSPIPKLWYYNYLTKELENILAEQGEEKRALYQAVLSKLSQ